MPTAVSLEPGARTISAEKTGFRGAARRIDARAGESSSVTIELATLNAPAVAGAGPARVDLVASPAGEDGRDRRFHRQWWFWTGAAALVVTTVVTAVVLSSGDGEKKPNTINVDAECAGAGVSKCI